MAALSLTSSAVAVKESSFLGSRSILKSSRNAAVAHAGACSCATCRRTVSVRASAENSTSAAAVPSATFASVAQSAPAPTSGGSVVPAVLGAGALGAAAYFVVKSTLTPAAPAAPAAPSAPTTEAPPSGIVPRATRAAPGAVSTMASTFPNAMQEEAFMHAVAAELRKLGFKPDNCIAMVNTCRDEVCRPVVSLVDREFGLSFNISGLGGLVNCGKTGFLAAFSHSPEFPCETDGTSKERYVFFAFPHVSIGESGEVGSLLRRGRGKPSSACGALIAIKNDINSGKAVVDDADDAEYVTLKKKVMSKVVKGDADLNLVQVTKAAMQAINDDLETLISLTVDPKKSDYAVITGVQIHSGNQIPGEPFRIERTCDYIAADRMYAVVRGQKYELALEANKSDLVAA